MFMGDYTEGLNPTAIKWSVWTQAVFAQINKISVENFTVAGFTVYQLAICGGTNTICKVVPSPGPDYDVNSINQFITTAPVSPGGISTFLMLDFSIPVGLGNLTEKIYVIDKSSSTTLRSFKVELATYHGKDLQRLINATNDKILIYLQSDQTNPGGFQGRFLLDKIDVYYKKMWNMRPALTQST